MFLVDDLLLSPATGFLFICKEIQKAARTEVADTGSVVQQLQELYMQLETGRITEDDFARQETELLDRLEQAEKEGQAE